MMPRMAFIPFRFISLHTLYVGSASPLKLRRLRFRCFLNASFIMGIVSLTFLIASYFKLSLLLAYHAHQPTILRRASKFEDIRSFFSSYIMLTPRKDAK